MAPESWLCPPGWAGIVVIGGAALATAPDQETACLIEQALGGLAADALTSAGVLSRRLPIAEIRGPATLAYLDPADFRPQPAAVGPLDLDHPRIQAFLQATEATDPADLEESGMGEITTPAFAVRQHSQVVAAAGYRDWPGGTAHLSVLTAASARGRGLARPAASAAVAHAIAAGRLPQWRARPETSRRVARTLGFRELGAKVSLRLAAADPALPGRLSGPTRSAAGCTGEATRATACSALRAPPRGGPSFGHIGARDNPYPDRLGRRLVIEWTAHL